MENDRRWHELAQWMVRQQLVGRGIRDPGVLDAMRQVPRHRFVPGADLAEAYGDHALPTRQGQTISQPYMVALMTELLGVQPGMKVLEVGTGSGYQAAVLAHMGAEVFTIESLPELAEQARALLDELGYAGRVHLHVGDGTLGWPPPQGIGSPFAGILVTAGAPRLPAALKRQLADGGRLVIPLGSPSEQTLTLVRRQGDQWHTRPSVACRFVPLRGADGW